MGKKIFPIFIALTSDKNNDIMVYKEEKSVRQIATAVGDGAIAGVSAKIYIDNLGW